jgi:hypothetical protein
MAIADHRRLSAGPFRSHARHLAEHVVEQLPSGLGNGSRLLEELGAFGRENLATRRSFRLRHRPIAR